jgi:predicted aspartyl protease
MKITKAGCLILLGLALEAGADEVRLKNGHTLEGIIAAESETAIELTVPGGSISLTRSSIASLIRSPAQSNSTLEKGWRDRRYLDPQYVPAGLEAVASSLRSLEGLRARAGTGADLRAVADYLAGIHACSQALAVAGTEWFPDSQSAPFLDRARDRLALAQADFRKASIQPQRRGNAFLVPVLINGRAEGRFILDTGAEITTISRALADRAGMTATNRIAYIGMADGTQFHAPVLRLDSLRLGTFERLNTEAVMLPQPPGIGIDGLLGMNILGSFLMRFDPASGKLDMEQFVPSIR